jgi:hypothetical protein
VRRGLASASTLEPGDHEIAWDGLGQRDRRLSGLFTVRVAARSEIGPSRLEAPIALRLAAPPRG